MLNFILFATREKEFRVKAMKDVVYYDFIFFLCLPAVFKKINLFFIFILNMQEKCFERKFFMFQSLFELKLKNYDKKLVTTI